MSEANINQIATTEKQAKNQKRGTSKECKKIRQKLENFDPMKSVAFIALTNKFGEGITHVECRHLAEAIDIKLGIKLPREDGRRYPTLIKWFDENWEMIEPNLNNIILSDKNSIEEIANEI